MSVGLCVCVLVQKKWWKLDFRIRIGWWRCNVVTGIHQRTHGTTTPGRHVVTTESEWKRRWNSHPCFTTVKKGEMLMSLQTGSVHCRADWICLWLWGLFCSHCASVSSVKCWREFVIRRPGYDCSCIKIPHQKNEMFRQLLSDKSFFSPSFTARFFWGEKKHFCKVHFHVGLCEISARMDDEVVVSWYLCQMNNEFTWLSVMLKIKYVQN